MKTNIEIKDFRDLARTLFLPEIFREKNLLDDIKVPARYEGGKEKFAEFIDEQPEVILMLEDQSYHSELFRPKEFRSDGNLNIPWVFAMKIKKLSYTISKKNDHLLFTFYVDASLEIPPKVNAKSNEINIEKVKNEVEVKWFFDGVTRLHWHNQYMHLSKHDQNIALRDRSHE